LASVKYLLRLLESGRFRPDNTTQHRLVESSRVAIERAETIIYDIMAVAKAGEAGIPVFLGDTSVREVVDNAIQLVHAGAAENSVAIEHSEIPDDLIVRADPKLLVRVLDNLLYNAVRHTPAEGRIHVSVESAATSVIIHIRDGGPGLGDIEPAKLFEKYGQLHLRAEGRHRGVGLGLYFCKLAVTGMGGVILTDDHPDGGAVFSVKLNCPERTKS